MDYGFMVSVLTRKRKFGILILILALIVVSTLLVQYQNAKNRYYPYYASSNWRCEDPSFSLSYSTDGNALLSSYEVIEWNGEVIEVDICFLMREFCIYPATSSSYQSYDDRLLSGTWKYRNGNFVLIVIEDFVFDNKYSELVFYPCD